MPVFSTNLNASNLTIPPTTTMEAHIAANNPHPNYLLVSDLKSAVNTQITVSELKDVVVGSSALQGTILQFKGAAYVPVTINEVLSGFELPIATEQSRGVIQLAVYNDITSKNRVKAVTPYLLDTYVSTRIALEDADIRNYINSQLSNVNISVDSATTQSYGIVKLATQADIITKATSTVVTPELLVNCINSAMSNVVPPDVVRATTSTYGIVRLAADEDTASPDEDPDAVVTVRNRATQSNLGLVKVIETDNPAGKSKIADLITNIHVQGNTDRIVSYVPQIQYNQFVNVHIIKYPDTEWEQIGYYKTHPNTISADNEAETSFRSDIQYQNLIYLIYSNGVLSDRTSYDSTIAASARDHIEIHVLENGAAYDINTCGKVFIHQEGNIKRWVVNSDCFGFVQGIAHNVNISASASQWGAYVYAYNHGHIEYAVVEGTGQLICAAQVYEKFKSAFEPNKTYYEFNREINQYVETTDTVSSAGKTYYEKMPRNAIVENITVCNGISNYAGLQVLAEGKGYNITLVNNASAYIYGYAKDVVVHSGCCLFVKDTVSEINSVTSVVATAKIDNLILYKGARVFIDSGAEINGLIAYPGAVIMPEGSPKITTNTCHEPNHIVEPMASVVNYYRIEEQYISFIGRTFFANTTYYEFDSETKQYTPTTDTASAINKSYYTFGEAITAAGADYYFTNSKYWIDESSHFAKGIPPFVAMLYAADTEISTVTYSGTNPPIINGTTYGGYATVVYATTPPRCFVRSDIDKLGSMRALNIIDESTAKLYNQLSKGAVQCYPANIVGISDPNAFGTVEYTVVPGFGLDAYHEQSDSVTDNTEPADPEIDPGVFVTSTYSLPFYQQIQSKMYDELTTPDTSIVWKIVF